MAKKIRRAAAGAAAVLMLAASLASAHSEMDNMVFAGYDTTDPYNPNKIYNEVINGRYTNKQVLVPVEAEWKFAGYENAYPHAGYSTMYLEGKKQAGIAAYNNLFPQWETRRSDYEWEIQSPHYIWERQQTKINNKVWTWDFGCEDPRGNAKFQIPDATLKTKTARTAVNVSYDMKNYGFGYYNNQGQVLSLEEQAMYKAFGVDSAIANWKNFVANYDVNKLSAVDENNRYVVSDMEIAEIIPVVRSKYVTAQLNKSGAGKQTKNVAAEYLVHGDNWKWDSDSFDIVNTAEISWSAPLYEAKEPYNQYQYLIVNGIVLDGKDGKDRIYRYTHGIAAPKVEWKFAFFQESEPGVYEVIEQKFLDGTAALVDNAYVYRIPAGKFGKTYFVTTDDKIQYWVADENGHKALLKEFDKYEGNLGGNIDGYDTASYNVKVQIPAQP